MKQNQTSQRTTTRSTTTGGNGEVLAPAGQPDSVLAAVRSGADSIYLGMHTLNARRSAKNFDYDQLEEAVRFCRLNGVKVYVTLNTILFDSEREDLIDCIQAGCDLGVDAFIVQDFGAARLARQMAPDIALHGSTQMSVHTPAGAQLLKEWGFRRVVLAREMSLQEIAEISCSVDIELEAFVHGALCMCVSGQCYLSGMLGGRSANRGMCAQPCRLPFSAGEPGRCDLSLKDLSAVERVGELLAAGVCSLKIEGRMKRPEYVAAAVKACRDAVDGRRPELETLRAVFSRSGFTDGYLDGITGPAMFGMRMKEDVVAASPKLFKQLENSYQKPVGRVPVSLRFRMKAGEESTLTVNDGKNRVSVTGQQPEPARSVALDSERLAKSLTKLGGTVFTAEKTEIEMDGGLSLPVSELNRMRRDAVQQLTDLRETIEPKRFCLLQEDKIPAGNQTFSGLRAEFDRFGQIPFESADEFEWIALGLDELVSNWDKLDRLKEKLMILPPRGMFGNEQAVFRKIQQLRDRGLKDLLVQNLAHIQLGKQAGLALHGGFSLNLTNTESIKQAKDFGLEDCVLSPELTLEQIRSLGGEIPKGALVYGHLPLMLTRNCPVRNTKSCADCGGRSHLIDRKGMKFEVRCRSGCSELYNPAPLWMGDRMKEFSKVQFGVLKFTYESQQQVRSVLHFYKQKVKIDDNITRGLYYRGVE